MFSGLGNFWKANVQWNVFERAFLLSVRNEVLCCYFKKDTQEFYRVCVCAFCQICDISAKKFGQMLSLFECINQINSCDSNLFENSCKLTPELWMGSHIHYAHKEVFHLTVEDLKDSYNPVSTYQMQTKLNIQVFVVIIFSDECPGDTKLKGSALLA